jgi:hypothetical protein
MLVQRIVAGKVSQPFGGREAEIIAATERAKAAKSVTAQLSREDFTTHWANAARMMLG